MDESKPSDQVLAVLEKESLSLNQYFGVSVGKESTIAHKEILAALAEGLEEIFCRPVDLFTTRSIRNPFFRRAVDQLSNVLYTEKALYR